MSTSPQWQQDGKAGARGALRLASTVVSCAAVAVLLPSMFEQSAMSFVHAAETGTTGPTNTDNDRFGPTNTEHPGRTNADRSGRSITHRPCSPSLEERWASHRCDKKKTHFRPHFEQRGCPYARPYPEDRWDGGYSYDNEQFVDYY
jgi:hypothetical protein